MCDFLFRYPALLLLTFFSVFLSPLQSFSQYLLKGKITDAATQQPLPGATLFLSNTQVKGLSKTDGSFAISVPFGTYNLIVTNVGYETAVVNISSSFKDSILHIPLQQKTADLGNITVRSYDRDGWKKWGELFISSFIGTSAFARQCNITNPDVIHFVFSKKKNVVIAFADEPLEIDNKALGYHIRYQLERFASYDNAARFEYEGYPLFTEMEGNAKQQRKWKENRMAAFHGSEMQFMRALYRNTIREAGYEVRHLYRATPNEKKRVQDSIAAGSVPPDSVSYYTAIINAPSGKTWLSDSVLVGDSIAYGEDSVTAALLFNCNLQVKYLPKTAPKDYLQSLPAISSKYMESDISLQDCHQPVFVESNGSIFPGLNILASGYWAWNERIARLLPFDYQLPEKD